MIVTKYTLHEHTQKKGRKTHWDIRIIRPDKKKAWSFAIPKAKLPRRGEKTLAIKTHDHKLSIMDFDGKHEQDIIKILEQGSCDILQNRASHITILFKGNILRGLFAFINTGRDKWLMIASK